MQVDRRCLDNGEIWKPTAAVEVGTYGLFAAHRDDVYRSRWRLTHIESGMALGPRFETLNRAELYVDALESVIDDGHEDAWDFRDNDEWKRFPAKVRAALIDATSTEFA